MGNRVCEILGIEYPVIQAPMGWVTSAELAAAVSNAGADIIVATGFDEGGCMPSLAIGTMEAVSMIKAAVSVPVMAAGGMVNANTTKAAFALGAESIYAGTRFIASVENPASDVCKQDIVNCKSSDTILIPAIKSYYRVTPHKKALELAEMNAKGATVEQISAQMGGVIKNGMLDGNLDIGLNIIGGAIGSITSIKPAAEIVKTFLMELIFDLFPTPEAENHDISVTYSKEAGPRTGFYYFGSRITLLIYKTCGLAATKML